MLELVLYGGFQTNKTLLASLLQVNTDKFISNFSKFMKFFFLLLFCSSSVFMSANNLRVDQDCRSTKRFTQESHNTFAELYLV